MSVTRHLCCSEVEHQLASLTDRRRQTGAQQTAVAVAARFVFSFSGRAARVKSTPHPGVAGRSRCTGVRQSQRHPARPDVPVMWDCHHIALLAGGYSGIM